MRLENACVDDWVDTSLATQFARVLVCLAKG